MADGNPIIDLYRSMTKSSDPEVKSYALKMGFKDFSNKIVNDKDFRDEIYYGLSQRGITNLEPVRWEQSLGIYQGESQLPYLPGDSDAREKEAMTGSMPESTADTTEPIKEDTGFVQGAVDFAKDLWQGLGTSSLQADVVDELTKKAGTVDQAFFNSGKNPNLIDFDKVAALNKEIQQRGQTKTEAEFYNDETRGTPEWLKMLVLSGAQSYNTLVQSGWDEMLRGAGGGAVGGGIAGAGVFSIPGAIAGAGTGLTVGTAKAAGDMEYMLSIMDGLSENNIDITNPDALRKAWGNKKLMDPIRADALKGTALVMGADLLGAGFLRKITKARKVAEALKKAQVPGWKKTVFGKIKDKMVDVAIEGTAGGSGEFAKKLATKEGPLTKKDYLEIGVEIGAEAPIVGSIASPVTSPIGDYVSNKIEGVMNPQTPAQAAPAAAAPARETVGAAVGQEEYDNFVNNNVISEGRASAVAQDAQLAMQDPKHLEQIMVDDPLYAGMVEKFIDKGLGQAEVETFTQAAYLETAQFYNMSMDELKNALTEGSSNFNPEISKKFNETFNNLFQAYKQVNDSQDGTGVSGQVGGGQESQQAQPQQGGGTQEAGGSGVLQAPGQEVATTQGTVAQVGQVVQIDGKRYYVKDEGGGKLVVETEEGKIYEIPSDNPTIESIGATLLREAQPDKNYGIQVDNNNTATINGEKYVIIRDKQGNITAAKNQRRGNISLTKPEVLNELSRQLADPNLRQLTTVSVQQPLTQVNETVQPEGGATTTAPTQPQQASTEMAGQTVQEGGQGTGVVQPGTEAAASSVGAPVSGVTTEAAPKASTKLQISTEEIARRIKEQSIRLNKGEILDINGNPIYDMTGGITTTGLKNLTDKKYGHGSTRANEVDSLDVLNNILETGDFKGWFGEIGAEGGGPWTTGKFFIASNNIDGGAKGKINPSEVFVNPASSSRTES